MTWVELPFCFLFYWEYSPLNSQFFRSPTALDTLVVSRQAFVLWQSDLLWAAVGTQAPFSRASGSLTHLRVHSLTVSSAHVAIPWSSLDLSQTPTLPEPTDCSSIQLCLYPQAVSLFDQHGGTDAFAVCEQILITAKCRTWTPRGQRQDLPDPARAHDLQRVQAGQTQPREREGSGKEPKG